jgi:acid phosphatase (class A)
MKIVSALLLLAVAFVPALAANYAGPEAVNFAAVLPPPAAADSPTTTIEIDQVLALQKTRTPEQAARCAQIEAEDIWRFGSEVVGPWFTAANLPKTAAFFAKVREDIIGVNHTAKALYPRRRPSFVDPRVQPCVECKDTPAYPSGHGIQSSTWALLLGAIFPDRADDFILRAATTRNFKAIAGVHYPSDLAAGQAVGEAFGRELLKNAEVQQAIATLRAEAAAARTAKP